MEQRIGDSSLSADARFRRLISSNRKRVRDQARLLALVASECTDGGAGAGFAAGVRDLRAEQRTQPRFDERPCAHVFRFFLAPDELGVFWKWLQHFAQLFFCERIKLLDTNDRCDIDLALGAIVQQIIIDFARAKNDSLYFIGWNVFSRLRRDFGGQAERVDRLAAASRSTFAENFFEPAMDEFFGRRGRKLRAQQTFWCRDDERLNEVPLHLSPQHVKILSSSR